MLETLAAWHWLKLVHVACAALSLALFALRGTWMIAGSPRFDARWAKVVPHIVDTVFLATGIGLALRLSQYPLVDAWLTAKVFGLVAYIMLGSLAFRPGRPRAARIAAFFAALAVFGYIVGVARARSPWSWLAWL